MRPTLLAAQVGVSLGLAWAFKPCPLLGPAYPAPFDLSSDSSAFTAAWKNYTSQIENRLKNDSSMQAHSFSLSTFSIHDPQVQAGEHYAYHHTGTLARNATKGTRNIDGNSIYRLGSISKAWTVYLVLAELGPSYWDRPVTDFITEIAQYANSTPADAVNVIDWKRVTLGAIAAQLSGLPREAALEFGDLANSIPMANQDPANVGLPPLSPGDLPICTPFGQPTECEGADYLNVIMKHGPVFSPWHGPSYSNAAYGILAIALERITGRAIEDIFEETLIKPLQLTATTWHMPTNISNATIMDDFTWALGNESAAGNIYSSLNDMNKFGHSILNSTLLDPIDTAQWLKPVTHTADVRYSVGRPWEILRFKQPVTGRTNDLFTKGGSLVYYQSALLMSPDHGAGVNILVAGPEAAVYAAGFLASSIEMLFPALEAQAAREAQVNFAGTYRSTDPGLNSSVTISVDPANGPGLRIDSWTSNGTDFFSTLTGFSGLTNLDIRLYPSTSNMPKEQRKGQMGFRLVIQDGSAPNVDPDSVYALTSCISWFGTDSVSYGDRPLQLVVFDVDDTGKATGLSIPGLRVNLTRASSGPVLAERTGARSPEL